ncbi:hypothetical protein G3N55_03295 [Dissulfurirhabdus thermomarina]|uniref:Polysaccharide chain length determinant N-terminal domain-containing protein n=1 Tax=Dissulfurirhabdus thermomarina TaxID=1765737 RepID=A0A6N9TQ62_DISTH|nr:hypothetical protein [Dissulfurirhabdus thermomarina]NDY41874.1 hypothetical protein [Dissulfurirhabdus thermomarina]NMX22575.1 hypothetical protein [Dissulfurirhabdus thermomarina]
MTGRAGFSVVAEPKEGRSDCEGLPGEIHLVDLLHVLWLHKALFAFCLLLFPCSAGFWWYAKGPAYRSEATVAVGRLTLPGLAGGAGLRVFLEDPVLLKARLSLRYKGEGLEVRPGSDLGRGLLELCVQASSPAAAQQTLERILADLLAEHRRRFAAYQGYLRDAAALLDVTDADGARARQGPPTLGRAAVSGITGRGTGRGETAGGLHGFPGRLLVLGAQEPFSCPTRVLEAPTLPGDETGPGLPLVLVLGLVLGGAVGALSCLFLEALPGMRRRFACLQARGEGRS